MGRSRNPFKFFFLFFKVIQAEPSLRAHMTQATQAKVMGKHPLSPVDAESCTLTRRDSLTCLSAPSAVLLLFPFGANMVRLSLQTRFDPSNRFQLPSPSRFSGRGPSVLHGFHTIVTFTSFSLHIPRPSSLGKLTKLPSTSNTFPYTLPISLLSTPPR